MNRRELKTDLMLTIPHVGCSHFMHIVHRKIKQLSRVERTILNEKNDHSEDLVKDVWYRSNMYSMSLLVNARTLYEFDTVLEDVAICLSSETQTDMLQAAYRRVDGRIKNMDKVGVNKLITDFPKEKVDANSLEELEDSFAGKSSFCNPFVKYFEKKLQDIEERVEQDSMLADDHEKTNRSYCPPFLEFIIKYIAEMPLWSGVLLGKLERYQTKSSQNKIHEDETLFLSFSSAILNRKDTSKVQ
jgi:hypothetical protein